MTLKRIIIHWTAGSYTPNGTDKRHYHFIVAGDGQVVPGNHAPEANINISQPNNGNTYAAHTRGMNTGSIGVSFAAMGQAKESPFNAGPWPINSVQVNSMVKLVAGLCRKYKIPVTRETVLTHAEVEPVLGVKQRGKWDVRWLPGMAVTGNPITVGDVLRRMISAEMEPPVEIPAVKESWLSALIRAILRLFGKGKS